MRFINKTFFISLVTVLPLTGLFLHQHQSAHCGLVFDDTRLSLLSTLDSQTLAALESRRSVSLNDVCHMPVKKLERALYRLEFPKPDHPGEAATFRYQQQLSENNQFNAKKLAKGAPTSQRYAKNSTTRRRFKPGSFGKKSGRVILAAEFAHLLLTLTITHEFMRVRLQAEFGFQKTQAQAGHRLMTLWVTCLLVP